MRSKWERWCAVAHNAAIKLLRCFICFACDCIVSYHVYTMNCGYILVYIIYVSATDLDHFEPWENYFVFIQPSNSKPGLSKVRCLSILSNPRTIESSTDLYILVYLCGIINITWAKPHKCVSVSMGRDFWVTAASQQNDDSYFLCSYMQHFHTHTHWPTTTIKGCYCETRKNSKILFVKQQILFRDEDAPAPASAIQTTDITYIFGEDLTLWQLPAPRTAEISMHSQKYSAFANKSSLQSATVQAWTESDLMEHEMIHCLFIHYAWCMMHVWHIVHEQAMTNRKIKWQKMQMKRISLATKSDITMFMQIVRCAFSSMSDSRRGCCCRCCRHRPVFSIDQTTNLHFKS